MISEIVVSGKLTDEETIFFEQLRKLCRVYDKVASMADAQVYINFLLNSEHRVTFTEIEAILMVKSGIMVDNLAKCTLHGNTNVMNAAKVRRVAIYLSEDLLPNFRNLKLKREISSFIGTKYKNELTRYRKERVTETYLTSNDPVLKLYVACLAEMYDRRTLKVKKADMKKDLIKSIELL